MTLFQGNKLAFTIQVSKSCIENDINNNKLKQKKAGSTVYFNCIDN